MTERKQVEDDMRRAIVQGARIAVLALGIVGAMVAAAWAIREVHRQMAKDPGAFAAYRKCQQQCGYEPRDTDTPGVVTEEMGREIVARRMACEAQGIECKYPGHPYGEMAQPSERSPWRTTRNGLVEDER